MPKDNKADTKQQDDKKETFEDLVGKEQSADKPDAPNKGEQSNQKPDAPDKPDKGDESSDQSGGFSEKEDQHPIGEGAKPTSEDDSGEGNQLFWQLLFGHYLIHKITHRGHLGRAGEEVAILRFI